MNREIKFRTWDTDEKSMNYSGILGAGSSADTINIGFDGQIRLQNAYGLDCGLRNPVFDTPEGRFHLMQYAGQGVYEGDVMAGDDGDIYVCEWLEVDAAFVWSLYGFPMKVNEGSGEEFGSEREFIEHCYFSEFSEFEVIGNIYENPELISGKEAGEI